MYGIFCGNGKREKREQRIYTRIDFLVGFFVYLMDKLFLVHLNFCLHMTSEARINIINNTYEMVGLQLFIT